MPLREAQICVLVDDEKDVRFIKEWIDKWELKFRRFRKSGCGCCVIIYNVIAPSSAIAELPSNVLVSSEKFNS